MKLCRVEGSIVATIKHPDFHAQKLMVVQPVDGAGKAEGHSFIAVDRVQAGKGDLVLVSSEGNGTRQLFRKKKSPLRSLILGIVDAVTLDADA